MTHITAHVLLYIHSMSNFDRPPYGMNHVQLLRRCVHLYYRFSHHFPPDLTMPQFAELILRQDLVDLTGPVVYMRSMGDPTGIIYPPGLRLINLERSDGRIPELIVWCRFIAESKASIEFAAKSAVPSPFPDDNLDLLSRPHYFKILNTFARDHDVLPAAAMIGAYPMDDEDEQESDPELRTDVARTGGVLSMDAALSRTFRNAWGSFANDTDDEAGSPEIPINLSTHDEHDPDRTRINLSMESTQSPLIVRGPDDLPERSELFVYSEDVEQERVVGDCETQEVDLTAVPSLPTGGFFLASPGVEECSSDEPVIFLGGVKTSPLPLQKKVVTGFDAIDLDIPSSDEVGNFEVKSVDDEATCDYDATQTQILVPETQTQILVPETQLDQFQPDMSPTRKLNTEFVPETQLDSLMGSSQELNEAREMDSVDEESTPEIPGRVFHMHRSPIKRVSDGLWTAPLLPGHGENCFDQADIAAQSSESEPEQTAMKGSEAAKVVRTYIPGKISPYIDSQGSWRIPEHLLNGVERKDVGPNAAELGDERLGTPNSRVQCVDTGAVNADDLNKISERNRAASHYGKSKSRQVVEAVEITLTDSVKKMIAKRKCSKSNVHLAISERKTERKRKRLSKSSTHDQFISYEGTTTSLDEDDAVQSDDSLKPKRRSAKTTGQHVKPFQVQKFAAGVDAKNENGGEMTPVTPKMSLVGTTSTPVNQAVRTNQVKPSHSNRGGKRSSKMPRKIFSDEDELENVQVPTLPEQSVADTNSSQIANSGLKDHSKEESKGVTDVDELVVESEEEETKYIPSAQKSRRVIVDSESEGDHQEDPNQLKLKPSKKSPMLTKSRIKSTGKKHVSLPVTESEPEEKASSTKDQENEEVEENPPTKKAPSVKKSKAPSKRKSTGRKRPATEDVDEPSAEIADKDVGGMNDEEAEQITPAPKKAKMEKATKSTGKRSRVNWSTEEDAKLLALAQKYPEGTKDRFRVISAALSEAGYERDNKKVRSRMSNLKLV